MRRERKGGRREREREHGRDWRGNKGGGRKR